MGMLLTIRQDGMLDGTYNLIYSLAFTTSKLIKGDMTEHNRILHIERAVQVAFGNMANRGNQVNGHQGMNGIHISRFDSTILHLETSCCLEGIDGSKGEDT